MGETKDTVATSASTPPASFTRALLVALALATATIAVMLCRTEVDGGGFFLYTSEYRRLSVSPYAQSMLQSRSLVPFIASVCGLGGENYRYFSFIVVFLFLTATAFLFIRTTNRVSTACIGTILLGSLPVTEFNLFALGWPDQFCGLMLVLSLLFPAASILFSILGLLAHEMYIALLVSAVVITPRPLRQRLIHLSIPLLLVWLSHHLFAFPPRGGLGPNALVRGFLANPSGQLFNQPVLLGFVTAMKVFLVLIPYALYRAWKADGIVHTVPIILPIVLAASCLCLAHDSTRVWSLAFPSMLIAVRVLSREQLLLTACCISNLGLPSYSVSHAWIVHLERTFGWIELVYRSVTRGLVL